MEKFGIIYLLIATAKIKKDSIERETTGLNSLFLDNSDIHWKDDDKETIWFGVKVIPTR